MGYDPIDNEEFDKEEYMDDSDVEVAVNAVKEVIMLDKEEVFKTHKEMLTAHEMLDASTFPTARLAIALFMRGVELDAMRRGLIDRPLPMEGVRSNE